MNKIVTAIDFDGTIVDSVEECFKRSKEAWRKVEKTEFPMNLEDFRKYRWSVKIAEHYYQNAKLFELGIFLPEEFEELELQRKKTNASSFVAEYIKLRKKAMQEREVWFDEHRLFEGIPQMFEKLESVGTVNTITTTRDKESVTGLLVHFKIDEYADRIYAREENERSADRNYQFEKLLKDYRVKPSNVIAYDDLPDQLMIAKKFGFLTVAAPQGYGRDKDLAEYIKAEPEEFASLVESIIKRGKK